MQIGDKMRSNDPRTGGKVVTISAIENCGAPAIDAEGDVVGEFFGVSRVAYRAGRRAAWVSVHLIFPEGAKHCNRGWTIIREN